MTMGVRGTYSRANPYDLFGVIWPWDINTLWGTELTNNLIWVCLKMMCL